MRHGQEWTPQYLLELFDPHLWLGLSSPLEYGQCDCEAGCECDRP